ncbi:MAG: UDP-N-acetylmuramoylalanyl-D-glutamyl-2,6-diaminopimelate--D-alanyl-D-alanine ligase [Micavibrio aeruginosavorus]|nr:UDP-N-acetylmuramoylalanyl-D-glutamyl-2,6-diaminopimelate--D-alanyl-D-alanine ligase [Micavibrio aeruginosavorus]
MTASSNVIWTAPEAEAATGGKAGGVWAATGLSIDTRTLQPGDLFIALKGDRMDGHDCVSDALTKGAAAVMVSRMPTGVKADAPILLVDDTFTALQGLGRFSRHRSGAKVIAVTGSVGKTGTKEMLARVFGALGQIHASKGSFNNHWGVPFSLAAMHSGCDYGIFEIGMNHAGEIAPLARMVQPDVAIITTVEPVHLENFKSVEEIADAKAEIFEGLSHGGTAVINRDNPHYARLLAAAKTRGLKTLSFGENQDSDARLEECLLASNGSRIRATVMGEDVSFTLLIPGKHIAMNALSVLLAVKAVKGDLKKALTALETIQPVQGRGNRESLDLGDPKNPVTLIDESYNASPVAMRAAFKVLALIDPGRGGRRIAILGDMLELGADAPRLHAELAMPLQAANVSLVYTCGPLMKNLHDALPPQNRGDHRDNSKELAQIVPDVLVPGDVVMVKGSHGSRMDVVVEAMRKLPGNGGLKGGIKNAL